MDLLFAKNVVKCRYRDNKCYQEYRKQGGSRMMRGKVKWFNNAKGFGFIEYKEGEDIFVHFTSIITDGYKSLIEGEQVEFDLVKTEKGFQAKNVREVKPTTV